MECFPTLSVIIPVRNEEKYISTTIGFIKGQDYPPDKIEILVADGESEDKTEEIVLSIAEQDPRVSLLKNPRRLSSSGRNIGINNAVGEIIVFIDGHTFIDNDQLFNNIVRLMSENNLTILSRPQFLDTPKNSFFQNGVSLARRSLIGHGLDSNIYSDKEMPVDPTSSGAIYKREVFDTIGIYDERFDACEDYEFNYRAARRGFSSFTSMKLVVYYYPRESLVALYRQMRRYGIGRFRLAQKYPRTVLGGAIVPSLAIAVFFILGVLSFWSTHIFLIFAAVASLYVIILVSWSIAISLKTRLLYITVLPAIYFTIHFGLGLGFLIEFIRAVVGRGVRFSR